MKTLQEYILEAKMSQEDFLKKIRDIYNDDYDEPYNIIKNKKYKNKLKKFCANKNISSKITVELEDYVNLPEFIDTLEMLNKNKNLLKISDLQNEDNDNIFELVKDILFKDETYKDDKEFLDVLTNISKFKVNVGKTAKGRFEYFLYFFLNGNRNDNYQIGDVIINDNTDNKKITQIEVKYCKDANFKPYNSGSLSKSSIKNISECNVEGGIVKFLLDCLINEDKKNNNNSNNEDLIKQFVNTYFDKNKIHVEDIKNLKVEDIKKFIGTCQFYLYLHNEFLSSKNNNYLILFYGTSESSKNYGDYILLDVNEILDNIGEIIDFSLNNFKWGAIHRNAIQFTLNK